MEQIQETNTGLVTPVNNNTSTNPIAPTGSENNVSESTVKTFLNKRFTKNVLIRKGIIAAIALALVLIFSLSFYFWLHNKADETVINKNKFWYIEIIWNDGIGFSGLRGQTGAIYAIQTIMFIALLAIFLLLTNRTITCSFISLAMFGGLFNLLQRAAERGDHSGMVLDYFKFGFWENFAIFNWPDIFVVIGIFGFVISYIVLTILDVVKEKREENAKNIEQTRAKVDKWVDENNPEPSQKKSVDLNAIHTSDSENSKTTLILDDDSSSSNEENSGKATSLI